MSIAPQVLFPYLAGALALVLGLLFAAKRRKEQGLVLVLAPILVAIGMAVFGADHLTDVKGVAAVVPRWMPAPMFWAAFVGVALVASATGLSTGIAARAAIGLLGVMIFCFSLMVFAPVWIQAVSAGKATQRIWLTLMLRDMTLGWCYLAAWAGAEKGGRPVLVTVARHIVALGIGVFGVMLLLHPEMAPGIPQDGPQPLPMPAWIPAHPMWTYATGVIFLVGAVGLLLPALARKAALLLGSTCTVLAIALYVPITILAGRDIDNGLNYLAITVALAGGLLFLASALQNPAK